MRTLKELEADLAETEAEMQALLARQRKATYGILSAEINKLGRHKDNIQLNINQAKQRGQT
jgi:hypothetical protein